MLFQSIFYREHDINSPKLPNYLIDSYKKAVETYEDEVKQGISNGYGFFGSKILRAKEFLQKELIYKVAKYDEFVTPCTAGALSYVIMEGDKTMRNIKKDGIGNIYENVDLANHKI